MVNGQTTTLTRANNTSESLRTTVPSGIIKQFGLKDGKKLNWKLIPREEGIDGMAILVIPEK